MNKTFATLPEDYFFPEEEDEEEDAEAFLGAGFQPRQLDADTIDKMTLTTDLLHEAEDTPRSGVMEAEAQDASMLIAPRRFRPTGGKRLSVDNPVSVISETGEDVSSHIDELELMLPVSVPPSSHPTKTASQYLATSPRALAKIDSGQQHDFSGHVRTDEKEFAATTALS